MKGIVINLLIVSGLSLGSFNGLAAQTLSADRFLEGVSKRYVGDQIEQDQYGYAYMALNTASAAEVERVLPTVLQYTHDGNEAHARGYAVGFLLGIAIRTDGADLLSSRSEEISSLIVDANPGIQKVAVAITDSVIAKAVTNKKIYVSALKAAIQRTQTPQDVTFGMVEPLLFARFEDPSAVKPVLAFLYRDDLTVDTRRELVDSLGTVDGLPEEIVRYLSKELDDPDPTVRVSALIAFAHSATAYHTLARDRVQRMANDPQENPKVRELAKEAIEGKTDLDPNVLVPNVGRPREMPADKPSGR